MQGLEPVAYLPDLLARVQHETFKYWWLGSISGAKPVANLQQLFLPFASRFEIELVQFVFPRATIRQEEKKRHS